jgi:hypothetical protein
MLYICYMAVPHSARSRDDVPPARSPASGQAVTQQFDVLQPACRLVPTGACLVHQPHFVRLVRPEGLQARRDSPAARRERARIPSGPPYPSCCVATRRAVSGSRIHTCHSDVIQEVTPGRDCHDPGPEFHIAAQGAWLAAFRRMSRPRQSCRIASATRMVGRCSIPAHARVPTGTRPRVAFRVAPEAVDVTDLERIRHERAPLLHAGLRGTAVGTAFI